MKIAGNKSFSIYIYQKDHPPPHCHIRYKNGEDISVDIPLIMPRYGKSIKKEAHSMIEDYLDRLCEEWDRLHPSREEL